MTEYPEGVVVGAGPIGLAAARLLEPTGWTAPDEWTARSSASAALIQAVPNEEQRLCEIA